MTDTSAPHAASIEVARHRQPAGSQSAGRQRPPNDYAILKRTIQSLGLLDRRLGYYAIKGGVLAAAVAGVWVVFAVVGNSWLQIAVAAALGVVLTHVAFLSHDAAHRQIFSSGRANEWLAICMVGLVLGMSVAWWQRKHTRHHASPNQIGKDPDIASSVLKFYPEPYRKRGRVAAFLVSHQGWWFFPILTAEGLNLHAQSVRALLSRGPVKRRGIELLLMVVRWAAYLTVLFVALSPGIAGVFLAVQLVVFGVYMGCTFAPSHKGMPIVPHDAKPDFFRRQVLMSRNITGSEFMTFLMGGLNYQIEHHLFPSMPRPNLRRARDIVKPFCAQRAVPYAESSLLGAYAIVVRYLNRVGLSARDPFECPIVASYRPRG